VAELSERLTIDMMTGIKMSAHCLTSQVGTGSSAHCLLVTELSNFATSSSVTGSKSCSSRAQVQIQWETAIYGGKEFWKR